MAAASFVDGVLPFVLKPDAFTLPAASQYNFISYTGTITGDGNNGFVAPVGFFFAPTIKYSKAQLLSIAPAFYATPTFQPLVTITDTLSILAGFVSKPIWMPGTSGGAPVTPMVAGFYGDVNASILGTGTGTITEACVFLARGALGKAFNIAAGITVPTATGLHVGDGAGAGVITDLVAVEIDALTKGANSNLSLRSAGAAVEMRHAGPARFGSSAAGPTGGSILHVDGGLTYKRTTFADVAYTVLVTDLIVENTLLSTVNRVVTLPLAATAGAGKYYIIKKGNNNVNSLVVTPSGGELIDGAANLTISAAWGSARIYSTGTAWMSA